MKRAIAIALLCTSCSLFMREPPATLTPLAEPDCSSSRIAPAMDLVGAGTTLYIGLLILALDSLFGTHDHNDDAELAAGVIGLGGTTAFIASAVNGFGTASRCREAKSTWYLTMAPNAPNRFPPPPPGYERGWCREPPGAPCNPGLTCASSRCVLLPPPPVFAPPPPPAAAPR